MNRSLITGLTLATVAGSAGAFAGVAAGSHDTPASAQPQPLLTESALLQPAPTVPPVQSRTVSYQVGAAGTVTLTVANGSLTINQAAVGAGWTVAESTAPGTHVEVQYTDSLQLVTFGADVVNNDVVVSLTNAVAPGAMTTAPAADPINVTAIKNSSPAHSTATALPQPATPPPTAAPASVQPPTPSATTAPSGSGDDDNHDDEHEESNDD